MAGGELIDDYDNEEDGDVDMSDKQTLFCTPVLTNNEKLPLLLLWRYFNVCLRVCVYIIFCVCGVFV